MIHRPLRLGAILSVLLLAACGGPPPYTGGDVVDLQRTDVTTGTGEPAVAGATADRILSLLDEPVHVGDVALRVRASVGVATADDVDGLDATTLVDQADRAMYHAKEDGGSRFHRLG